MSTALAFTHPARAGGGRAAGGARAGARRGAADGRARRRAARSHALRRAAAAPARGRPARRERVGDAAGGARRAPRGRDARSTLHLSTPAPGGRGDALRPPQPARRRAGSSSCAATARAFRGARAGERLALAGGGAAELVAPYLSAGRLWIAALELPAPAARLPRRATGGRSATPTSRTRGRSPTTRRSSRPCPAAPRCRAPGGRSRRVSCVRSPGAASASRRSSSTPA